MKIYEVIVRLTGGNIVKMTKQYACDILWENSEVYLIYDGRCEIPYIPIYKKHIPHIVGGKLVGEEDRVFYDGHMRVVAEYFQEVVGVSDDFIHKMKVCDEIRSSGRNIKMYYCKCTIQEIGRNVKMHYCKGDEISFLYDTCNDVIGAYLHREKIQYHDVPSIILFDVDRPSYVIVNDKYLVMDGDRPMDFFRETK